MENNVETVIRAINEVDENIWLGDRKRAKGIADLNLALVEKNPEIYESVALAKDLSRIVRESRKIAEEKKVEDVDSWITDRISEKMKQAGRRPIDNLVGILVIHLTRLRDVLDYLVKSSGQKTLEPDRENETDQEILRIGKKCRFTIRSLPDRWEVRAVLDEPVRQWNLNELESKLSDFGLWTPETPKDRMFRTLRAFSREMFADILVQERQVEFSVRLAGMEDEKERIQKLVKTVVEFLVA